MDCAGWIDRAAFPCDPLTRQTIRRAWSKTPGNRQLGVWLSRRDWLRDTRP